MLSDVTMGQFFPGKSVIHNYSHKENPFNPLNLLLNNLNQTTD